MTKWLLVLCLGGMVGGAWAHKPSDSYLTLRAEAARITGQWDIALRDLDHAIGLDADGDGQITWGELRARHADIAAYAGARLKLRGDGRDCTLAIGPQQVDEHTDGAYSVLPLVFDCGVAAPAQLEVGYSLFADIDPQHRGLLKLGERSAVLDPARGVQAFALDGAQAGAGSERWRAFVQYLREGVWHIWIGFDHILFLISLLLPAVGLWAAGRWQPAERFGTVALEVLKVVTAFTLAHSITLSLATLGWVSMSSRWVESAIAASVVLAALNNVWPLFAGNRWWVAFAFGLVHGFGFASVLADLGLPAGALALALLGFNLGVELGQLAIVAVFLPLAFALRRTLLYRRGVLVAGSLLIALLAGAWFVERAFELTILPA
jgi:HupE / UreJ protein